MVISKKVLIIRFSSFGDIVQAMSVLPKIRDFDSKIKVDWLTKSQFSSIVRANDSLSNLYVLKKEHNLFDYIRLCFSLKKNKYDFIYDAHSNLRSLIFKIIVLGPFFFISRKLVTRKKDRFKRLLLFVFKVNKFPKPFCGAKSYLVPLEDKLIADSEYKTDEWKFSNNVIDKVNSFLNYESFIALAPSAAWEMKRWPIERWKQLILLRPESYFVILGGPSDHFCEEIASVANDRVLNLSGKLSLIESSYVISQSKLVISADTGLIHVAEILGRPGLSLIGPTAFGFPTSDHIKVIEVDLPCRPCSKDGRGSCRNDVYQKCMVDISAKNIASYF